MQDILNKNFANSVINKPDINDYFRATSMYQIRES